MIGSSMTTVRWLAGVRTLRCQVFVLLLCAIAYKPSCFGQYSEVSSTGLNFRQLTVTARGRCFPGGLCVVKGQLENGGSATEQGRLVAVVDGRAGRQDILEVELEAGGKQEVELQVRIPKDIKKKVVRIEVALKRTVGDIEVILENDGRPIVRTSQLPVEQRYMEAAYALALDPPVFPRWGWPPVPAEKRADYELAVAAQVASGYSRHTVSYARADLPLCREEWQGIDVLQVSDSSVLRDRAAAESISRFLSNGGRVWVMLDLLDCSLVEPLLSPSQAVVPVGEVLLTKFVVEPNAEEFLFSEDDRTVDSPRPIRMKRVLQEGGEVSHTVDGWPASITMRVGRGELMLTTLGCDAWMQPRTRQTSDDPLFQSDFMPSNWAGQFVSDGMFVPQNDSDFIDATAYPLSFIGSPVVPRLWVAMVLAAFCVVLAVGVAWRAYSGDLSVMGAMTPAIAFALGGMLLAAKNFVSMDVEECVAKFQYIEVSEDGNYAAGHECAAVFLEDTEALELAFDADGTAAPAEGITNGIHQFVHADFQDWRMANGSWPNGTWQYESDFVLDLDEQIVVARFTDQGCEYSIPKEIQGGLSDAVVAFAPGQAMLGQDFGELKFADGVTRIGPERWIAGTLISNEQKRRLEIYDQMFASEVERRTAPRRVLYGWTELWQGPKWSREFTAKGNALVRLPVRLLRPKSGEKIFVPYGMVELRQSPGQPGSSTAYNERTGRWRPGVNASLDRQFQFVMPEELRPFQADSVSFEMDVSAPKRIVEISVVTEGGEIPLARLDGPSLPWVHTETNPLVLAELEDGRLDVRVQVSARTDVEANAKVTSVVTWKVDYFNASIRGSVANDGL